MWTVNESPIKHGTMTLDRMVQILGLPIRLKSRVSELGSQFQCLHPVRIRLISGATKRENCLQDYHCRDVIIIRRSNLEAMKEILGKQHGGFMQTW